MHDGQPTDSRPERRWRLPPRWRPLAAARPAISAAWWQWIASRDSLTARLVVAGGERRFRVRLLGQQLARPALDEALVLGLPPKRYAWCREVVLCLDDRPWVVARSVAPLEQLRGQRLDRLGERSLGSWLFRQPGLERSPIEVTASSPPFQAGNGPWGRRSVFRLGAGREDSHGRRHGRFAVLVQEYFLDTMRDDLGLPSR
ncbi:chorismate--pyruvate lyase family protein [Halomonas korlensis]|uniref:Probable chorismate pyruvate-lyase n=1 Tax=Halomonas korlensis TaxID=463301 RepID=A0A1I7GLN6_9GAMM|nr:chorismate lyase [Halomonas korlensis]SFU49363.1 chorismate lyase [Halomonas korlensis]